MNYEDYSTSTIVGGFRNYPKRLVNITQYSTLNSGQVFVKAYNFTFANFGEGFSLSAIKEIGTGNVEMAPYTFTYLGTSSRIINTKGIDKFGFYNGKVTNNSLVPAFGANREPDFEFAKIGAIQSITYPTGGKETYEYELNDYSYVNGEFQTGTLYIDSLKFLQVIEGTIVTSPNIYITTNTPVDISIVVPPGSPSGCGSTYKILNHTLVPKAGNAPYTIHDLFTILTNHGYCFGNPTIMDPRIRTRN